MNIIDSIIKSCGKPSGFYNPDFLTLWSHEYHRADSWFINQVLSGGHRKVAQDLLGSDYYSRRFFPENVSDIHNYMDELAQANPSTVTKKVGKRKDVYFVNGDSPLVVAINTDAEYVNSVDLMYKN